MARIFVSSTFEDLEECREKVRLNLSQEGHESIAMEYYVAENKKPVIKCPEDVASCDLYIGIFAWRYGYVPDGYDISITELEYRKAVEAGKECLVFLLNEDAPWPTKYVDKGKNAEKIAALRNELSNKHIVSFFKSVDELARLVGVAVHKWENGHRIETPTIKQEIPRGPQEIGIQELFTVRKELKMLEQLHFEFGSLISKEMKDEYTRKILDRHLLM
jgi:hypothetical protein